MEDIKKVEYEIYNNGFVKVLGVKEVKYTDEQLKKEFSCYNEERAGMTVDEYGELGLNLRDDYFIKARHYYLSIKTNSSEYNPMNYGSIESKYLVHDYKINKKGLYACDISIMDSSGNTAEVIRVDRCEVESNTGIKYYAYGMNNQELERIENEASLMAANYSGIMAVNYAIGDDSSKDGYLRNYNEYKKYFTNQLILNRSLNNSVEDETFKEKIKKNKSI